MCSNPHLFATVRASSGTCPRKRICAHYNSINAQTDIKQQLFFIVAYARFLDRTRSHVS